jgi:hypothetical protein
MDICENCNRTIGKLETAHVWQNHIVCPSCHSQLAKNPTPQSSEHVDYQARQTDSDPQRLKQPIIVKPDFWRDPNVGAIGVLILAIIAAIFCYLNWRHGQNLAP